MFHQYEAVVISGAGRTNGTRLAWQSSVAGNSVQTGLTRKAGISLSPCGNRLKIKLRRLIYAVDGEIYLEILVVLEVRLIRVDRHHP